MTTDMLLDTNRPQTSLIGRMMSRVAAGVRRRDLRKHLLNLDDRMLRDVGLTRQRVMSDEF